MYKFCCYTVIQYIDSLYICDATMKYRQGHQIQLSTTVVKIISVRMIMVMTPNKYWKIPRTFLAIKVFTKQIVL